MIGIINVLKPPAMTSHDVIYFIRKLLKEKQVGHTGTLDPAVSGVLPICVGKATKLSQFITDGTKVYRGQMVLGKVTDSQDAHGKLIAATPAAHITSEAVYEAKQRFTGDINQIPPMVSAVKIGGQKLYELHNMGKEIKRQPRPVTIERFDILDIAGLGTESPTIEFSIKCSKGTYIRTICHDLGQVLGVGGHLNHLVRTASGSLTITTAFTLEELAELVQRGVHSEFLLDPCSVLQDWWVVQADNSLIKPIGHGNMVPFSHLAVLRAGSTDTGIFIVDDRQQLIAFGSKRTVGQQTYLQPTTVI